MTSAARISSLFRGLVFERCDRRSFANLVVGPQNRSLASPTGWRRSSAGRRGRVDRRGLAGWGAVVQPEDGLPAITADDIRPGDVAIFSPYPNSATARGQVVLTGGAPYSHAALVYRDPRYLIEAIHWDPPGPSRVMMGKVRERFAGRTVTILRPKHFPRETAGEASFAASSAYTDAYDAPLDPEPVLRAADSYLGQPFSRSNEYLQGIYYLYRRLALCYCGGGDSDNSRLDGGGENSRYRREELLVDAFRVRIVRAMKDANSRLFPGRQPVMCAEFVYRCFRDAGPRYRLEINGDGVGCRGFRGRGEARSLPRGALADPLDRFVRDANNVLGMNFTLSGRTCEEKVAELIRLFGGDEIKEDTPFVADVEEELVLAICELLRSHCLDRENPSSHDDPTASFSSSRGGTIDEALLLTPSDLCHSCSNLCCVGIINM